MWIYNCIYHQLYYTIWVISIFLIIFEMKVLKIIYSVSLLVLNLMVFLFL